MEDIKSSLLNEDEFKFVKNSILLLSEKDDKTKFRVKTVEYINDSADDDDDMFFYDMMEFIRFLDPNDEAIAYTTPDKLICLNCPGNIGENLRYWDFIYDHECLHQLWDTFGVGDKIEKEKGSCDHEILNIASDCVINDYLSFIRKKTPPPLGITVENLKSEYGVEYDRKVDTQYTLYLKMLESPKVKALKKAAEEMNKKMNDNNASSGQQGNKSSSGSSSSSSSSGSKSDSKSIDDMNENEAAQEAQKQANEAKEAAAEAQKKADNAGDKNKDELNKKAAEAKKAAEDAQKAADKAKKAAKKGDKEGAQKAAKEAKEAADKAKQAVSDKGGKPGNDHKDIQMETPEDLEEIRKRATEQIDRWRKKISGDIGTFVNKCKKSLELNPSGLSVGGINKGNKGWDKKMNSIINGYVKSKVAKFKRQFVRTYSRVRRGSGIVKYGEPLLKGKKVANNRLTINVGFYLDRSGSMGSCLDRAFKALYTIAESLKKQYAKEQIVEDVVFKIFAFDTDIDEIKYGHKCNCGGGTMSFNSIIKNILNNTKDFIINVIITDAEFDIEASEIKDLTKQLNGILIFITNTNNETVANLSKNTEKLEYILADSEFAIS